MPRFTPFLHLPVGVGILSCIAPIPTTSHLMFSLIFPFHIRVHTLHTFTYHHLDTTQIVPLNLAPLSLFSFHVYTYMFLWFRFIHFISALYIQHRLTLLFSPTGTGESGKSTIAKQMKIMHLDGFTKEERDTYRSILHSNIIDSMSTLLRQAAAFGLEVREDLKVY